MKEKITQFQKRFENDQAVDVEMESVQWSEWSEEGVVDEEMVSPQE